MLRIKYKIFVILLIFVLSNVYSEEGRDAISPYLKHILNIRKHSGSGILTKSSRYDSDMIDVFIRTDMPQELYLHNLNVSSVSGNIATAKIPLSKITEIANLPYVKSVNAAAMCRPLLDVSVTDIGADKLHAGYSGTAYTGKGVIVGVVDYGIDWSHQDFISGDTSRILFIWDQTDDSGPPPADENFNYGTEYKNSIINDALRNRSITVGGRDYSGHGTHVAGIAAGNGRASGNSMDDSVYVGVAPDAGLVVVKLADNGIVPQTQICDAVSYVFDKADKLGLPAVVNISFGTQRGPHNGTSDYEMYIDQAVSEKSGRAVVVAAGNDGNKPIHFKGNLSATLNDSAVFDINVVCVNENQEDNVSFDIWYKDYTDLEIKVVSPKGDVIGPKKAFGDYAFDTASGTVYLTIAKQTGSTGDVEMLLTISDTRVNGQLVDTLASGTWKLIFYGKAGQFHGWLYDTSVSAQISSNASNDYLIAEPGNSMFTVTVGSYVSRTEWPSLFVDPWGPGGITQGEISSFSSPGPTRSEAQKPTIAAPGEYIVSSLSSFIQYSPDIHFIANDSVHTAMKGTSMAAPHVTGAIALFFQKNPNLSVSQIKSAVIYGAQNDVLQGEYWDDLWGFGKFDAFASMQKIETQVVKDRGSTIPEDFEVSNPFPNPFNSTTNIIVKIPGEGIKFPTDIVFSVYSITGEKVFSRSEEISTSGETRIVWDTSKSYGIMLSSGIYIYKVSVQNRIATGKVLLLK